MVVPPDSFSPMLTLPPLPLAVYEFTLRVLQRMPLPAYKGGVLRGGFGAAFKRLVCIYPDLNACAGCTLYRSCVYPAVFEPSPPPDAEVLRTQDDITPPFVIDPPRETTTLFFPGDLLRFRVVLIGRAIPLFPYFVITFRSLGESGLGQARARYRLHRVSSIVPEDGHHHVILDGDTMSDTMPAPFSADGFNRPATDTDGEWLRVRFLTPTRLKHEGRVLTEPPPFHVLARALMRRLSTLSYFYGGHRWETDYRGWIEQAQAVETVFADARWVDWERYSTRQRQTMNLGGIVGDVTYRGPVAPFLPLLRLGEIIHVGKNAVFGNGRFVMMTGTEGA